MTHDPSWFEVTGDGDVDWHYRCLDCGVEFHFPFDGDEIADHATAHEVAAVKGSG